VECTPKFLAYTGQSVDGLVRVVVFGAILGYVTFAIVHEVGARVPLIDGAGDIVGANVDTLFPAIFEQD